MLPSFRATPSYLSCVSFRFFSFCFSHGSEKKHRHICFNLFSTIFILFITCTYKLIFIWPEINVICLMTYKILSYTNCRNILLHFSFSWEKLQENINWGYRSQRGWLAGHETTPTLPSGFTNKYFIILAQINVNVNVFNFCNYWNYSS